MFDFFLFCFVFSRRRLLSFAAMQFCISHATSKYFRVLHFPIKSRETFYLISPYRTNISFILVALLPCFYPRNSWHLGWRSFILAANSLHFIVAAFFCLRRISRIVAKCRQIKTLLKIAFYCGGSSPFAVLC